MQSVTDSCTLYDVGEQDGTHYLVMEYIEGETLADRLTKGPLPLDQALSYGIQIADALDKAHRQGVVHRDLKPGNVMLTKPGAKLLDFGLAKFKTSEPGQVGSDLSALPTEQKPLTKEGSILGTFQYMAPEQLEGKEADARTDIFAFGSMLYEMVTGKRAFEGKSQASLISAIMSSEPRAISELQPMSPPHLDHLVKRCLDKEPDRRWQSAFDVALELRWIDESRSQAGASASEPTPPVFWKKALTLGLTALITAAVTGIVFWSQEGAERRSVKHLTIPLPSISAAQLHFAMSADGQEIVYAGRLNDSELLYRRSLIQRTAIPISGTEDALSPFFSPDGRWVGFASGGKLKKVSLEGGPPVTLCDVELGLGSVWAPDNRITFSSNAHHGLLRIQADGGEPQPITFPDASQGEIAHRWPDVILEGKAVLFSVWYGSLETMQIAVQSMESGQHLLLTPGTYPRYVPTGHVVFFKENSLWALPFDASRLEATGPPLPVVEGIQANNGGLAYYAVGEDGSLVYSSRFPGERRELVWVDRQGRQSRISEERNPFWNPRLSPDNQRLAIQPNGMGNDVWIYDLGRGPRSRLTFEGGTSAPLWTPTGDRITYASGSGISWKQADGSGEAELLLTGDRASYPHSWSPDGKALAFYEVVGGQRDIRILPLEGDRTPVPFVVTRFNERSPSFSPDGRWIAYASDESGRDEVYLVPYPGPGEKVPVSTDGGWEPVWCPSGGELFYRNGDQVMSVPVETAPGLEVGIPQVLFEGQYAEGWLPGQGFQFFDVSSDCQRFVMVRVIEESISQPATFNIVLNWFDELENLVPTDN